MDTMLVGMLIFLIALATCVAGYWIGCSVERNRIVLFLWGQPRSRSTPQIIFDIERRCHRKPDVGTPDLTGKRPNLPYGFVEQLQKIANTPEREGYTTRVVFNGGMRPYEAKMIIETLEVLSGGDISIL